MTRLDFRNATVSFLLNAIVNRFIHSGFQVCPPYFPSQLFATLQLRYSFNKKNDKLHLLCRLTHARLCRRAIVTLSPRFRPFGFVHYASHLVAPFTPGFLLLLFLLPLFLHRFFLLFTVCAVAYLFPRIDSVSAIYIYI